MPERHPYLCSRADARTPDNNFVAPCEKSAAWAGPCEISAQARPCGSAEAHGGGGFGNSARMPGLTTEGLKSVKVSIYITPAHPVVTFCSSGINCAMSYTLETLVGDGAYPRIAGSTVSPDDRVQLVYSRFKTTKPIAKNKLKINLVFAHGTGMNKSIWYYHIRKLYAVENDKWQLNTVISIDACNHGDSALLNRSKNASALAWEQGGKDIIEIVKREQTLGEFLIEKDSKTIGIGHSMGASMMYFAGLFEPALFDAVMTMEAVMLVHDVGLPKFKKVVAKMQKLIKDTFDSEEEFDTYFKKGSFYTKFPPDILKEFSDEEKYYEDGKIKTKSTAHDQILSYYSSSISVPLLMSSLSHYQVPICHVTGKAATWNPPESIPWIRETLPEELVTGVDVEGGDHLFHGTLPDETVKVIYDYIEKRVDANLSAGKDLNWEKFRGDQDKLLDKNLEEMNFSKAKF